MSFLPPVDRTLPIHVQRTIGQRLSYEKQDAIVQENQKVANYGVSFLGLFSFFRILCFSRLGG